MILYASAQGTNDYRGCLGPLYYACQFPTPVSSVIMPQSTLSRLDAIKSITNDKNRLYQAVIDNPQQILLSGDHSSAMGYWQGHFDIFPGLKLLWIDAHLDAHTPSNTASGNIHGMPLAYLLGEFAFHHDQSPLVNALKPENLLVIGTRSYEKCEQQLYKKLGVEVIDQKRFNELGVKSVITKVQEWLGNDAFGISLDLDVIDPNDSPGVNTPEPGGIRSHDLLTLWQSLLCKKTAAIEIAEYNPTNDPENKTLDIVHKLMKYRSQLV